MNLPLPSEQSLGNDDRDDFWNASRTRSLQVIVTPYRDGHHYAKQPDAFIPVINQLEQLHKKGFVHGDIRGFNTVFKDKNQGYLIDFDFGGKLGEKYYPEGYRTALDDGIRCMDEGDNQLPSVDTENKGKPIHPWHDWYALGRLFAPAHATFPVATWSPPKK